MDFSRWKELYRADEEQWLSVLEERRSGTAEDVWNAAICQWEPNKTGGKLQKAENNGEILQGVPFLVKDLFDQRGKVTRGSSAVLREAGTPAKRNAAIIDAAIERGGIPVGRTNMNEFAYGIDGFNQHTGNCPNPLDDRRISGGSSSGSAWAVGSGVVPLAFGTDTGGSVRVPAAFCGLFGFRRGVDRFAAEGVLPLAPTFDTAGWFTRTPQDMVTVLDALWDGEYAPEPAAGQPQTFNELDICWFLPRAVALESETSRVYKETTRALRFRHVSSEFTGVMNALAEDALWAYNVIGSIDALRVHEPWLERFRHLYSANVWALIDRARHWEDGSRERAEEICERVAALLEDELGACDAIAIPAVHTPAPKPRDVTPDFRTDILQLGCFASLSALPVLTVPVRVSSGLSVGIQIISTVRKIGGVSRAVLGAL